MSGIQGVEDGMTVGQVAAAAGVAASAVRFYEAHGLITGRRTHGNQRRFDADAPCRVRMIRVCQRVGLSVAEIRDLLATLPTSGRAEVSDWVELGERIEREVHERIRNLRDALADLTSGAMLCELPGVGDTRTRVSA
ncbi:MerR family transcriptional regulator [Microbacterium lushaniae]|nr:MerR family transcriptional regulator [Microbacterium lushaniae]KAA9158852.1 MerR family transcriptional regulator [Microbacterium lushaniae]